MLYFTGDIHGDIEKIRLDLFKSLSEKDVILVAGDFGYCWNGKYESVWNNISKEIKANILITPGNHENYEKLYSYPMVEIYGGKVYKMNDNTFFLKHGEIFNIEGIKILSYGGATSVDKTNRYLNISWWPQEETSYADYQNAISNLKKHNWDIDILLSHTTDNRLISMIYFDYIKDSVSEQIFNLKEEIKYHNPDKEYLNIFGHLHHHFIIDNNFCLYSNVISIDKKDDKLIYNYVTNKETLPSFKCNECRCFTNCSVRYDMETVVCRIMAEKLVDKK